MTQAEARDTPPPLRTDGPSGVRLRQDALVERFDDAALVLMVEHNRLVTVNLAAAELFEQLRTRFGGRVVTPADLRAFLGSEFGLCASESQVEAGELVDAWLGCGLMEPGDAPSREEEA